MKRRDFLKLTSAVGLAAIAPTLPSLARADQYDGLFFLNVFASGGWDVTSFCDPKQDVKMNNWAKSGTIQTAGNISYAPVANNAEFFNKHYSRTLVINGIDHQTNSHTAGTRHMSIGRLQSGYPSIAELIAASYGQKLMWPLITEAGGYDNTENLVSTTKIPNDDVLSDITNVNMGRNREILRPGAFQQVEAARLKRLNALSNSGAITPRESHGLDSLYMARSNSDSMDGFGSLYSAHASSLGTGYKGVEKKAHIALLAAAAGLSVSATFLYSGFDTHANHDTAHPLVLGELTGLIDSIWTKAEELGIANRLVVFVNSDFGRAPWYNGGKGKDHWAIGSALVMKDNVSWTNRVIGHSGQSNELIAATVNPSTLQPDDNGVLLKPLHVHNAIRQLMGVDNKELALRYPLLGETVNFFS